MGKIKGLLLFIMLIFMFASYASKHENEIITGSDFISMHLLKEMEKINYHNNQDSYPVIKGEIETAILQVKFVDQEINSTDFNSLNAPGILVNGFLTFHYDGKSSNSVSRINHLLRRGKNEILIRGLSELTKLDLTINGQKLNINKDNNRIIFETPDFQHDFPWLKKQKTSLLSSDYNTLFKKIYTAFSNGDEEKLAELSDEYFIYRKTIYDFDKEEIFSFWRNELFNKIKSIDIQNPKVLEKIAVPLNTEINKYRITTQTNDDSDFVIGIDIIIANINGKPVWVL